MTKEEKTKKDIRKTIIKKKLSELQRKISLCTKMLSKARTCQTLLKDEYQELDRKLFEHSPGITILRTKKKTQGKELKKTEIFTSYDKMSFEEQEMALSRLLEIQTDMRKNNNES